MSPSYTFEDARDLLVDQKKRLIQKLWRSWWVVVLTNFPIHGNTIYLIPVFSNVDVFQKMYVADIVECHLN